MAIDVAQISGFSFRTSKSADDIGQKFMTRLGVRYRYLPARLAIGRSLAEKATPRAIDQEEVGKAIPGHALFGKDLQSWTALIVQHGGRPIENLKDLQVAVAAHWDRGMKLLESDWMNQDEDFDRFLNLLAGRGGIKEGVSGRYSSTPATSGELLMARPILLRIGDPGTDLQTRKPVDWLTNGPGFPPHLALMGGTNSGKTHLALGLLRQFKRQTNCPIIFFDIAKGDIAGKRDLVEPLDLRHVRVPQESVPLNFLSIQDRDSIEERNQAAMSFRDSFERVAKGIGAIQKDALRDAVTTALLAEDVVGLEQVRSAVQTECNSRDIAPGTLLSTLNDLCAGRPLFQPELSPMQFFGKSWLIDLHEASDVQQKLVVFLLLDAAKRYFMGLPDSPTDASGNRAYRALIVIDEARRVLGSKHPSLSNLIRLARSKGVAIWMISQSPDDFDQEEDNFLENIGLAVSLRTNASRQKALRKIIGDVNLSLLNAGEAVTKLPGKQEISRVKAWEPASVTQPARAEARV